MFDTTYFLKAIKYWPRGKLLLILFILVFSCSAKSSIAKESRSDTYLSININPTQFFQEFKAKAEPNPFYATTTISYELTKSSYIEITITDRIGHLVTNLFEGEQNSGRHQIIFCGLELPFGLYMLNIIVKTSKESSERVYPYILDLFYAKEGEDLTHSEEEERNFNYAFVNIFDDPPRGLQLMNKLLKTFPKTIYKISALYMMLKGYSALYKNPLEYPPSETGISAEKGRILNVCRELITLAPAAVYYHYGAQELLNCKIELPLALEYAQKAFELNKTGNFFNSPSLRLEILHTLGKIYLESNSTDKALQALRESLQLAEKLQNESKYAKAAKPMILFDLGQTYEHLHQFIEAEQVFSEAYILQPSNKEIIESIKRIYMKEKDSLKDFDQFWDNLNTRALSLSPKKSLTRVNRKAAEFELSSLKGDHVKLSDFRGKVVLLNFWGFWCGSCKKEMPILQKLWEEFNKKELVIMAVHFIPEGIYSPEESTEKIKAFVKKNGLTFQVLLHKGNLASQYGGTAVPTTFLIDKEGHIQYEFLGFTTEEDFYRQISEKIEELLKKKKDFVFDGCVRLRIFSAFPILSL